MEFAPQGIFLEKLYSNKMKGKVLLFCLLAGCVPETKTPTPEPIFASEEEKLLNDAFLDIIGTDLYYKISEKELAKANSFATEKEQLAYYYKHRETDNSRIVVFTDDNFVSNHYRRKEDPEIVNLSLAYLTYIADALKSEPQLIIQDSLPAILQKVSQPLKLSAVNLVKTGRYQLISSNQVNKVKGHYKSFGLFSSSQIFISSNKKSACLYYEKRYPDCNKCESGILVILNKQVNKWRVIRKIDLYVTWLYYKVILVNAYFIIRDLREVS